MTTVNLAEFVNLAEQRDVFAYNLKLIDSLFDSVDHIFQGATVLDAGAGTRLKHFRRQLSDARRVIGVDSAYGDLRANTDVDAGAVGNMERLPFQAAAFRCILAVDAVEHLKHPEAFFREAARCLQPGGRLIICTPNLLGYKNMITFLLPRPLLDLAWRVIKRRPGQPHRTYYRANTLGQIRRIATAVGMIVEQAQYVNEVSHFFYPYPALSISAYLYGRGLERLGLRVLLNYMVCVLRKN